MEHPAASRTSDVETANRSEPGNVEALKQYWRSATGVDFILIVPVDCNGHNQVEPLITIHGLDVHVIVLVAVVVVVVVVVLVVVSLQHQQQQPPPQ